MFYTARAMSIDQSRLSPTLPREVGGSSSLDLFHPVVARWFVERFTAPTAPQEAGWREIAAGHHTLIAAPTGSGKTLAAFLWSLNHLFERHLNGGLPDQTLVVYVSPLKALSNDIERNLREPLKGIAEQAAAAGLTPPEIRVAVRTGDTPATDRARMLRHPPHILITTPESLFILLTAEGSRRFLAGAETVIVDEIHAVAGDKRGAHLALSLERLDALAQRPLQRIGLSATQKPIEEVGRLLVGQEAVPAQSTPSAKPGAPSPQPSPARGEGAKSSPPLWGRPVRAADRERGSYPRECSIVDIGHQRQMDLSIMVPDIELGPIATHEVWAAAFDHIVEQVQAHRATLVFVSTRRQAERVAHQIGERIGHEKVAAHHGSLSKEMRFTAERRLKAGDLPVIVATASLELGIDIGHVDLVCHCGAPRALASFLQRVGRSGHWLGAIPKGIVYPLTRDELIQTAATLRALRAGQLDKLSVAGKPRDILAQQIVAAAASEPLDQDELFAMVTRSYPYRDLERKEFDDLMELLSEGIATGRGRRSAHLHWDRVNGVVRGRRGARLAAITSGGAIPDVADYDVIEEPAGTFVGRVNEDFAMESMAGDIFLLGNQSWQIRRVESGKVRVQDAHGAPPTIPFWTGEAPPRTAELSAAVCELRQEVANRLVTPPALTRPYPPSAERPASPRGRGHEEAVTWLQAEIPLDRNGAEQIVSYIGDTVRVLGAVPTQQTVIAERFFDEGGGMQLVLHTPFGGRINRAWGLTLRKRFCVTFDFELQAAATDDGIVISLGEQHSFPLDAIFRMIRSGAFRQDLIQAALASPMFTNRWRWNAGRALAILRYEGGHKVPMYLQRMRADDLLAAVFPDQAACQDNRVGPIEPPDHPLVNETLDNCLHEAMDVDGFEEVLQKIERGEIRTLAVETPAPSPMSHELLNANPYAFLDDAPLEERRARAVSLRRTDPDLASGVGALDAEAIAAVRSQAWPDIRDPDELHDALLTLGLLPAEDLNEWRDLAQELVGTGRAAYAVDAQDHRLLVAAERLAVARALLDPVSFDPSITEPPNVRPLPEGEIPALVVQGWLEALGPTTAEHLAERLHVSLGIIESALAQLEGRGNVLRGHYTLGLGSEDAVHGRGPLTPNPQPPTPIEWCDRRLLARIHRLTLGRLRQEIEPVAPAQLLRFLLQWQHVAPTTQLYGRDGIMTIIRQLQGLELPATGWEGSVLPARIASYDPADLEQLCLAGAVAWGRLSSREREEPDDPASVRRTRLQRPGRQAPLALLLREDLHWLVIRANQDDEPPANISSAAQSVVSHLRKHGASFLADIARATGQMPASVEDALWQLVARGIVTGDGLAGLRVLLAPEYKRIQQRRHLRALPGGRAGARLIPTGRWALWAPWSGHDRESMGPAERTEHFAWQLLRRYGVVFRELLVRESQAPSWRELLAIYRRLEARGEVRGGRYGAGFVGEQFALPEAVEALRAVRRSKASDETVIVQAADPLNLVGVLTPGNRVSSYSNQAIAYRDGVLIEVGPLGAIRARLRHLEGSESSQLGAQVP